MKTLRYFVVFLLLMELGLRLSPPTALLYDERFNYEIFKDHPGLMDVYLGHLAGELEVQGEYIIILGDSVGYSGPGPASQSIGHYLQGLADRDLPERHLQVINLALPAMQTGDIYTMLLMLEEHGISTEHVIINLIYTGFVARHYGNEAVFWLDRDLARLDLASLEVAHFGAAEPPGFDQRLAQWLDRHVALLAYAPVLKELCWYHSQRVFSGVDDPYQVDKDLRPWHEKAWLREYLDRPEYARDLSDEAFDMRTVNSQIYFLERIIEHQVVCSDREDGSGRGTMFFLASANPELMAEQVEKPGFQENLLRVDEYFAAKPVAYLNLYGQLDQGLFTDQVHLTAEGYEELARILWEQYRKELQ